MMLTRSEPHGDPYRSAGAAVPGRSARATADEAPHPVVWLTALASLVRVAGAAVRHEVFGAEATLALMTLVGIAWWAIATRRIRVTRQ